MKISILLQCKNCTLMESSHYQKNYYKHNCFHGRWEISYTILITLIVITNKKQNWYELNKRKQNWMSSQPHKAKQWCVPSLCEPYSIFIFLILVLVHCHCYNQKKFVLCKPCFLISQLSFKQFLLRKLALGKK